MLFPDLIKLPQLVLACVLDVQFYGWLMRGGAVQEALVLLDGGFVDSVQKALVLAGLVLVRRIVQLGLVSRSHFFICLVICVVPLQ